MKLLKIAWRNLWRNRKRTLITIASVFFGVLWAVALSSLQTGSFDNMVDNMVSFTTGYAQIQNIDYKDNKSLNNGFIPDEELYNFLDNNEFISKYTSRLSTFSLIATGEKSYGTAVIGVNFENEDKISKLSQWIIQGSYSGDDPGGVLLGELLANKLEVNTGDTIILIGQGYHGVQVAGLFAVRGLLKFPISELNRQILYMDIGTAGDFFQVPGTVTSLILMVEKPGTLTALMKSLEQIDNPEFVYLRWEDLQPQLVQLIDGKTSSGKIFIIILFIIIAFGILGTFIMMIAERERELGIMIAIGMNRLWLSLILFLESLLIAATGVFFSFIFCIPLVNYFVRNPIKIGGEMGELYGEMGFEPVLIFSNEIHIFLNPAISIFIISIVIAIYPLISVIRLKAVNALRA